MEYYVSIHMSIMLLIVASLITIFLYLTPMLIKCKRPNTNIKKGYFYSIIIATWLFTGLLLLA